MVYILLSDVLLCAEELEKENLKKTPALKGQAIFSIAKVEPCGFCGLFADCCGSSAPLLPKVGAQLAWIGAAGSTGGSVAFLRSRLQ